MDVIVISVPDGTKTCTGETKSYFNSANVAVIMDLLIFNHHNDGVDPAEIAIITPYRSQVKLYNEARMMAVVNGLVPNIDCLPKIIWTADASQGRQAPNVIHDWVVSAASSKTDLGFTLDNKRATVAFTRARTSFISVVNNNIALGAVWSRWKDVPHIKAHLDNYVKGKKMWEVSRSLVDERNGVKPEEEVQEEQPTGNDSWGAGSNGGGQKDGGEAPFDGFANTSGDIGPSGF